MSNNGKYAIIGGQYRYHYYGFAATLEGAKRKATANVEYWDNWQGWHYPAIYRAEDVVERDGDYIPRDKQTIPVAERGRGGKWVVVE